MTFGAPIWLWLILPALAGIVLAHIWTRRSRTRALERFAAPQLLGRLLETYSIGRERFKAGLFALGVVCVMCALARPQVGYEWQEVRARGVDLVIAMDVSKSMLARDIKPDRLERAKLAVLDLVGKLKGDRVGLVAFAGEAFLQCPLTLDYGAFRQSLEAVEPALIPREGTNLGAAIAEASAAFDAGNNQKIIVLLTDGEDLEGTGLAQAQRAAKRDIVIYTVGVGTPQGDIIPVRDATGAESYLKDAATGKIVTSKLEDATLRAIADAAHGFYTPLGATGEGLLKVYESGWSTLPQEELAARQQRKPIERFQWSLALAVFLLAWEPLVGTRRRFLLKLFRKGGNAALATALLFAFTARETRAQDAEAAYARGDYEDAAAQWARAEDAPDGRLDFNRGTGLYKLGDYEKAQQAFESALARQSPEAQADTFFNLGNTRFMRGLPLENTDAKGALAQWEAALKDYDNALEIMPNDADAKHNRAIVARRIEELKKREEEKQKQQQNQSSQNQQQNQNSSSQNQDTQNQNSQNQEQNSEQNQNAQDKQNQNSEQNASPKNSEQNPQNQDSQDKEKQDKGKPDGDKNSQGAQGKENQQASQKPDSQNESQGKPDAAPAQDKQDEGAQDKQDKQDKQDGGDKNPQDAQDKNSQEEQNQNGAQNPEPKKEDSGKQDASSAQGEQDKGAQDKQDNQDKQDGGDKNAPEPQPADDAGNEKAPQAPAQSTAAPATEDAKETRAPQARGVADAKPQAEQSAQATASAAGDKKGEEETPAPAAPAKEIPGVLSRQDAGFLLDSLKDHERKLPAAPLRSTSGDSSYEAPKSFKNW